MWETGSEHGVEVADTMQAKYENTVRFRFRDWSDSGAAAHKITATGDARTLTAAFTTQYRLTARANPEDAGKVTVSPASSDNYYDAGTALTIMVEPAAGNRLVNWSDDLTGSEPQKTLTVSEQMLVTANLEKQ